MSWTASIRARFRRRRRRGSQEVGWLHTENTRRAESPAASEPYLLPLGGLLALFALGWVFYHFHFRSNPQFVLHELSIASGNLNEMLVRERLALHEGMPLFDPDIERRRQDLADAPNIRSVSITRRLPSRILVRVVEREPIGRVGHEGQVIDDEGVIFPHSAGVDHLPVLTGLEGIPVQPGVKLSGGMGIAAVRLLATLARPEYTLPVAMIDLSHQDYLCLTLADQRQVRLWWKGMDADTTESNESLRRRLRCLLQAMSLAPMRRLWDATVPDETRIFSPY